MSECLEMVGRFTQYSANTGYNVVQLLNNLDLESSQHQLDHGKMNAVIRYRTPYLINNRDPLLISFSLGDNISLPCVIGLHILLSLGGFIKLVSRIF